MIFTLSRNLVISLFLFLNLIFAVDYSSEILSIDKYCSLEDSDALIPLKKLPPLIILSST